MFKELENFQINSSGEFIEALKREDNQEKEEEEYCY